MDEITKPYVIGLDLGGTNSVFGIVDARGNIVATTAIKTQAYPDFDDYVKASVDALMPIIDTVGGIEKIKALGIGAPNGNYYNGTIEYAANLVWQGVVPIAKKFEEALGIPVIVTNDANAAAVGEFTYGVARGMKNFIMITLGTGVGSGIYINGQLVLGCDGLAGELGHLTVIPGGRTCGCGRKGCLEQYASATGVVRLYLEECERRGVKPAPVEHATDTLTVFRALAAGDECAKIAVDQMCEYLAQAMAQVSCIVDPAMYLIGGGVAGAFATFAPELRRRFAAHALSTCKDVRIEAAGLGNQAAMYGCAYEALRLRQERLGE